MQPSQTNLMKRKADMPGPSIPPPSMRPATTSAVPLQQRQPQPITTTSVSTNIASTLNFDAGDKPYIAPVVAVTQAVQQIMQQNASLPPNAKVYPATEVPFTGNFIPLPVSMKVAHPVKASRNDYSEASSPLLPPVEMYDLAFSLSIHTGKTIVLDYWTESLSRDQKIMVVELVETNNSASSSSNPKGGKKTFILMKNRQEFTSPIVEYHQICYFVNIMKDGQPTKSGACGYIFLTQNSIYLVKHPIKLGRLSMKEFEERNRELDD